MDGVNTCCAQGGITLFMTVESVEGRLIGGESRSVTTGCPNQKPQPQMPVPTPLQDEHLADR